MNLHAKWHISKLSQEEGTIFPFGKFLLSVEMEKGGHQLATLRTTTENYWQRCSEDLNSFSANNQFCTKNPWENVNIYLDHNLYSSWHFLFNGIEDFIWAQTKVWNNFKLCDYNQNLDISDFKKKNVFFFGTYEWMILKDFYKLQPEISWMNQTFEEKKCVVEIAGKGVHFIFLMTDIWLNYNTIFVDLLLC